MLLRRYGPYLGIWAVAGIVLLFLFPQAPFVYVTFYFASLFLTGWKMAHAQRWLEILRDGPHPLSPAAADWQPATETEKHDAAQTRTGWECLAVSILLTGIMLFFAGQFSLIRDGWQALTNSEITLKANSFSPASPIWAWPLLVAGILGLLGILLTDVLTHVWEGTPRQHDAARWRNRLSWATPLTLLAALGFWTGWLTNIESLAWGLSVIIFGGLFFLIVRWTW